MTDKRKSWQEKLTDNKGLPNIVKCEENDRFGPRWGIKPGDTFVIPAPVEVDEIMGKVPYGKLITINIIREKLSQKHGTKAACPITTGIFARIAAEAAAEKVAEGKKDITPYWRTLKAGGVINEKYPGGVEHQKELLEKEGYKVISKGKQYIVVDFEKYLVK